MRIVCLLAAVFPHWATLRLQTVVLATANLSTALQEGLSHSLRLRS
jgi:hypothetical protein